MASPRAFYLVVLALLCLHCNAQLKPIQLQIALQTPQNTNQQFQPQTQQPQPLGHQGNAKRTPLDIIAQYDMHDPIVEGAFAEMNLGRTDMYEGDIKLTPMQRDYILQQHKRGVVADKRALLKNENKLWEGGSIPYVIGDGLRDESKEYIESAIEEWTDKTCLNVRPKQDSDTDYIEFVYEGGCSSYVGRVGGKQTISVGSDSGTTCRHGNIVHELMHAIGAFHEHSRPDRDDFIEVKWDNIMSGYNKNFEKETTETVDSLKVPYDYNSVMHYGKEFFTNEKGHKTITTKDGDHDIGQRVGLSDLDVKQMKLLYKCEVSDDQATKSNSSTAVNAKSHVGYKKTVVTSKKTKVASKKSQTKKVNPLKKAIKHYMSEKTNKAAKHHGKLSTKAKISGSSKEKTAAYDGQFGMSQDWAARSDSGMQQALTTNANANEMDDDEDDTNAIGEENFGKNYFEGDMILTPDQQHYYESLKEGDGNQSIQGVAPAGQQGVQSVATKRALIKNETFLWPDRTVNYYFDESVDEIGRENARAALKHWEERTCLKFKETEEAEDYIRFVFEGGCASRVGRGGGMQKLTIGDPELRCKTGNIIHETGHALGMFHEHSRPDRDEFVTVKGDNVMPGYEKNFIKFSGKWIDSRNVPYDYGSIMHYGKSFFAMRGPSTNTLQIMDNGQLKDGKEPQIGQRIELSKMDILQANLLYNCDGKRRIDEDQRADLEADMDDQLAPMDKVPCSDTYNQKSCMAIKDLGYCEKFPRTLKDACGITCNMCSIFSPIQVPNVQGKKRAFHKLKKQLGKKIKT